MVATRGVIDSTGASRQRIGTRAERINGYLLLGWHAPLIVR